MSGLQSELRLFVEKHINESKETISIRENTKQVIIGSVINIKDIHG